MRQAFFHEKALDAIRSFPKRVQKELGDTISDLQHGASIGMPHCRPMPSVAPGACELRVRDEQGIYRAFYIASSPRGILVFHAFQKRTPKTPEEEIILAAKRLKEML